MTVLRARPPLAIRFAPEIVEGVRGRITQKECGGILACEPITESGKHVLRVCEDLPVRNMSRSPYRCYEAHPGERRAAIRRVLVEEGRVPIEFHSHPIIKRRQGSDLGERLLQMSTSTNDQFCADVAVTIGRYRIHMPEVVIIRDPWYQPGIFVGVYGGLIAPENFDGAVRAAGFKKLTELAESIKTGLGADGWFGQLVSVAPLVIAALSPNSTKVLAVTASKRLATAPYFGFLSLAEQPDIAIPARAAELCPTSQLEIVVVD